MGTHYGSYFTFRAARQDYRKLMKNYKCLRTYIVSCIVTEYVFPKGWGLWNTVNVQLLAQKQGNCRIQTYLAIAELRWVPVCRLLGCVTQSDVKPISIVNQTKWSYLYLLLDTYRSGNHHCSPPVQHYHHVFKPEYQQDLVPGAENHVLETILVSN